MSIFLNNNNNKDIITKGFLNLKKGVAYEGEVICVSVNVSVN